MKRTCLFFMLLAFGGLVNASSWRLVNENLITSDSDDADQRAHFIGELVDLPSAGGTAGLWVGQWRFEEPIGKEDFDVIRLSYEKAFSSGSSIAARVQKADADIWSPVLATLTGVHQPNERWRFEASYEKGWIDSVSGLRQRLGNDTWSISADWRFAQQWTVVGALIDMSIDDGNSREGGVLRLIYDVPAVEGLNFQTRSKWLQSDFDGNGYFSPAELEEHLLLVGYARPFFDDNWVFSIVTGAGSQDIRTQFGDRVDNDLYYLELGARGWFTQNFGLESKGFCTNTGGPNFGTPDDSYRYCHLLFSLIAAF